MHSERERERERETKIYLPGSEFTGAISWLEHVNDNIGEFPEGECRLVWKWHSLRSWILGGSVHSHEFFFQEPYRVLSMKIWEKFPHGSGRGKRRVRKTYSPVKTLTKLNSDTLSQLKKGNPSPLQPPLAFLSPHSQQDKCKSSH